MHQGIFIDWVSIRQQHQTSDSVGKNFFFWVDPTNGDLLSEGMGHLSHEGSYSTAVSIRSYNGLVEWSGNPSRFNRPDNVFGFSSMRDCLDLINGHLEEYGLPPFTLDDSVFNSRRLSREGIGVALSDGTNAVFTRVDICRNVSTGSPDALRAYLRAASAAVYRGKGASSQFEGSVAFGHARNSRLKLYDKAAELIAHTKRGKGVVAADIREYRQKLAGWCYNQGLLRQEITLGRNALRSLGLRSLAEWSDNRAFDVFCQRVDAMQVGCTSSIKNSFQSFVEAGYTERQAATLSGIVSRWYMGEPVSSGVSRATFYRYRSAVSSVLGVDLSAAPDIAVLTAQVQEICLTPVLEPPVWYQAA